MKLACLQIHSVAGNPWVNAERILGGYRRLVERGADLVVTPELALPSYNARDLFYRNDFVQSLQEALTQLQAGVGAIPLIVGTALPRPRGSVDSRDTGKPLFNAAVLLRQGKVEAATHKVLLPSYDVFEETRYFEPGEKVSVWEISGRRVAVTICEDLWHRATGIYSAVDPIDIFARNGGVDLLLNLSASPWHVGKEQTRQALLSEIATRCRTPVIWVNMVGGYDDILFDGQSLWLDAHGKAQAQGAAFCEEEILWDLNQPLVPEAISLARQPAPAEDQILQALIMGTRDYVRESGFKQVLLGLSGGLDSALVAVIAARALGPECVLAVGMPSRYSSASSLNDAEKLASNLGIAWNVLPIEERVSGFEDQMQHFLQAPLEDITAQNLQARLRGLMLMTLSNQTGRLLLTTGNKSELSVGYCTIYGDMCGGLAPIGDLFKTEIDRLARWMNREEEVIPWNTIQKPPSAELKPNQTDQDTLPPYDQLDSILQAYLIHLKSADEIARELKLSAKFVLDIVRRAHRAEYKRKQAATILRVSPCAFGFGRHYLITHKF